VIGGWFVVVDCCCWFVDLRYGGLTLAFFARALLRHRMTPAFRVAYVVYRTRIAVVCPAGANMIKRSRITIAFPLCCGCVATLPTYRPRMRCMPLPPFSTTRGSCLLCRTPVRVPATCLRYLARIISRRAAIFCIPGPAAGLSCRTRILPAVTTLLHIRTISRTCDAVPATLVRRHLIC